jgi:transglutaminase-like putative cysteine protease
METGPSRKSLVTMGLVAVVIMAPATVFAVTGDAPHILLLAGLGLGASSAVRRPLERNTRSFVYTGLSALVLAVLADQLLPVDPNRFFLMPAHVACPPVLFLAVAITFFDHRESNVSGVVGLSLLALMMSGNCMDFQVPHRRLPIPLHTERYLHLLYGLAVAAQLTAAAALMARAPYLAASAPDERRRRGLRGALTLGLLLLTAGVTLALRAVARHAEYYLQSGFAQLIHTRMGHGHNAVFGRDVDLWRTVPHRSTADEAIVLRALSAQAPGYLRGRVYTQYGNGRWSATAQDTSLPFVQPGGRLTYSIFSRPPPAPAPGAQAHPQRIDLYPSRGFRSDVLLAPGAATTFELLAGSLGHTTNGELTPSDWEQRVGYTVGLPDAAGDETYYGPTQPALPGNDDYLALPDDLRAPLGALGAAVFAGVPPGAGRAALAALTSFFGRGFEYALGTTPAPNATDPILPFLLQRRKGHCELFATAAVLLLRQHGVPARYVTGVVCAESAARGQWLARLGDVHAWAEAYDAETARWLLVEMTPASGVPQGSPRSGLAGRALGQLAFTWQHVFALVKRGAVAQGIVAVVRGLGRCLEWLIMNPVGAPLTVLLLLFLGRHWQRRRRPGQGICELPALRIRLRAPYLDTLSRLRRLLPAMPLQPTPYALAQQLRQQLPETPNPILAQALERYQQWRYGNSMPSAADIAAVAAQFRAGLREARRALRTASARSSPPNPPRLPTSGGQEQAANVAESQP